MTSENEVMLIAGERGGKSTFAYGLIHYVNRSDNKHNGRLTFEYGDRNEFKNKVEDRMENYKYPNQTDFPYLIQINFNFDRTWQTESNISLMDIPGEEQEEWIKEIKEGNWDRSDIRDRYLGADDTSDDPVKELIKDNKDLQADEWRTAYLYRYERSNQVICLLNLHKKINKRRNITITKDILERAANEKTKVALVITATDVVNFNPDKDKSFLEKHNFGLIPTEVDNDLYEHLDKNLNATYREIKELLTFGREHDRVDLFGVSVPADGPDQLKIDGNGFETHGFDRVISWLK